jgi:hypothetical protein
VTYALIATISLVTWIQFLVPGVRVRYSSLHWSNRCIRGSMVAVCSRLAYLHGSFLHCS